MASVRHQSPARESGCRARWRLSVSWAVAGRKFTCVAGRNPQLLHFLNNFHPHRNNSLTIVASDYLENINRRIMMRQLTNAVNKQKKKIKNEKLSLVVALALGGLVACSIMANAQDAQGGKKGGGKGGGRQTTEQRLEQMTTDLSLTDAQKPKVKAVLEETSKKMQEIRGTGDVPQDQMREKMQPIMEEQTKKMKEILTPEQQTKWQEQQRSRFSGGKGGGKGGGKKKTEQ